MHAPSVRIPEPALGDSGDIVQALEIARALWEKGNRRDAIRWVRHAVEAADEAGDPTRVAVLARAVADLGAASVPPPPPSYRPSTPSPVPQRPSAVPPQRPSTVPPPLPRAAQPKALPVTAESAPRPRPVPLRPPPPIRSAPPVVSNVPTPTTVTSGPSSELRRRVSVKTSVRDPNLLVVRPLADGQPLPPGAREAFLVMAAPADADSADSSRRTAR